MKRLLIFTFLLTLVFLSQAQMDVVRVDPFNKIMIHPYFEVELRKGTTEKVEFISSTVDLSKINVELEGKTLHLYLEDAKVVFKEIITDHFDPYKDYTKVKAIITYRNFQKLTVYGDEKVTVSDELDQRRVHLKIYGETDVRLSSVNAQQMKVALYGENKLYIDGGDVPKQTYVSYGENAVHAKKLSGSYLKFANFGNSKLYVGEQEVLKLTAFGDATISFLGNPVLEKKFSLGEMTLVSR